MKATPTSQSSIPGPIALFPWLAANADKLQPPVNNICLYAGEDFILMAVGGPNTRNDYHGKYLSRQEFLGEGKWLVLTRGHTVNETEEWFYQIKGAMLLKIVENGDHFRDVVIQEGETFLVPGNTPHSPIRYKDTIGLVMERTRSPDSMDRIRWYCSNTDGHQGAASIIREETFHCENIETQLKDVIDDWMQNESSRKCGGCGVTAPAF